MLVAIILVYREQIFVANNGEGGGVNFRLFPLLGPRPLDWTKVAHAQLDDVLNKIGL